MSLCVLQEICYGGAWGISKPRYRFLQVHKSVESRTPCVAVEEHIDLRLPPVGSRACAASEVARGAWAVVIVARPAAAVGRSWTSAVRAWPAHEVAWRVVPRVPSGSLIECPSVFPCVIHLAGNKMENKSRQDNSRDALCLRSFSFHRSLVVLVESCAPGCASARELCRKISCW